MPMTTTAIPIRPQFANGYGELTCRTEIPNDAGPCVMHSA
jgi:hypothetical protein